MIQTIQFSEVVMGGAGGAAAPPIIETVRVLRGVSAPPKILALRVLHPQYFDHNYLAGFEDLFFPFHLKNNQN